MPDTTTPPTREMVECECPERLVDMVCYGIHFCRDGKRIAPEDFYATPEDFDAMRSVQQGRG